MNTVRNILLVVAVVGCFVLGFVSGCQTIHGVCGDGKTAFTIAERVTRPLAEKQETWDSRMAEDNLHGQLTRAEREIIEANRRAERFANRNPMKATAEE